MSSAGFKKKRQIRGSRCSKIKDSLSVDPLNNAAFERGETSDGTKISEEIANLRCSVQKVAENEVSAFHEHGISSADNKKKRPVRASSRCSRMKDTVSVDPPNNATLCETQREILDKTKISEEIANLRSSIQKVTENEVSAFLEHGISSTGIKNRRPIRTSRHSKTKAYLSVDPSNNAASCVTQAETSGELSIIQKAEENNISKLHDYSPSGVKKRRTIKGVSRLSKATTESCLSVDSSDKAASSKIQEETLDEEKISEEILNLECAIQKVRGLSLIPPVYHYNIETENNSGLSAVDINRSSSMFAFAENDSSDIILKILLEDDLLKNSSDDDLMTMYKNFKDTKSNSRSRKKIPPSSPGILKGHAFPVTGLSFVNHKDLLLSCSLDGTVRAWNTEDFRSVQLYSAHKLYFCNIDVSEMQYRLNAQRLKCKTIFEIKFGDIFICGSWDSSFFATSCLSGGACLFSFEQKVPVRYFIGHSDDVECVKFHPNGLYIATASVDKTIKLWTSQNAKAVRTFADDCGPTSLAFSPDGTYLASYSGKYIKIWDLASGRLLSTVVDSDQVSSSQCLCFNACGKILASGGQHKKINMWDVKHISNQVSSNSSLEVPEFNLLKCHSFEKKIYLLKFVENSFFTCVTA